MAGATSQEFIDFVEATPAARIGGPKDIANLATDSPTWLTRKLLEGQFARTRMIGGGPEIVREVMFDDGDTAREVLLDEPQTFLSPQVLQKLRFPWKFFQDHRSWNKWELESNHYIISGNDTVRREAFVDMVEKLDQRMWTSTFNKIESLWFRAPDYAEMEIDQTGARKIMSLPVYINEDTNGKWNPRVAGSVPWPTVAGKDPAAAGISPRWQPQQVTYSSADAGNFGNILHALDEAMLKSMWQRPPSMKVGMEDDQYRHYLLVVGLVGYKAIQALVRAGFNGGWVVGEQDPAVTEPVFANMPIHYCPALDTAQLYNSGSNTVTTEALADLKGPRVYGINARDLYLVIHPGYNFEIGKVRQDFNTVGRFVQPMELAWQLVCENRRTQFIVSPSGDLYYS